MKQNIAISKHIVKRLGERGTHEVMDSLFPVNCQSCSRALVGETVALLITDTGTKVYASLHHRRCRKSDWNRSEPVSSTNTARLSHRMLTTLLPWSDDAGEPVLQPMFILNPGLEAVLLEQDSAEQWQVTLQQRFVAAGMVAGSCQLTTQPVRDMTVSMADNAVAVRTQDDSSLTYECGAHEHYLDQVQTNGGVLFVVTHALDPSTLQRKEELLAAIGDHRTAAGWVSLGLSE